MGHIREGFLKGMGFFLAIVLFTGLTALVAQTISTFKAGDTLSAALINDSFQYLKTRVDSPLPYVESASSAFSVTSSTTFIDVPNLSVTVTTSGSPIWLGLNSDGTGNAEIECGAPSNQFCQGHIQILRDGVGIAQYPFYLNAGTATNAYATIPATAVWHIDNPGVGTYVYKVQYRISGIAGDNLLRITRAKLVAARFNEQ